MALLTASLSRRPLPALHPWLLLLHPHPRPLRLPLPLLLLPHPLLLLPQALLRYLAMQPNPYQATAFQE